MMEEFEQILTSLRELVATRKPGELVRKHLFGPDLSMYVRINRRSCGLQLLDALVIADVTVEESRQGQGMFTRLLRRLEQEVPALGLQAVIAENVVNPHLLDHLERIGYRSTGWDAHTVYKESPYG